MSAAHQVLSEIAKMASALEMGQQTGRKGGNACRQAGDSSKNFCVSESALIKTKPSLDLLLGRNKQLGALGRVTEQLLLARAVTR